MHRRMDPRIVNVQQYVGRLFQEIRLRLYLFGHFFVQRASFYCVEKADFSCVACTIPPTFSPCFRTATVVVSPVGSVSLGFRFDPASSGFQGYEELCRGYKFRLGCSDHAALAECQQAAVLFIGYDPASS